MTQTVDFIFDFGSPNAYMAHKCIPAIAEQTGAEFRYIPCLLGGIHKSTNNQPPMIAFGDVKGKLDYSRLEMQRFIKKHQLTKFTFNSNFPVITLMLMRGAIAAEQDGNLMKYIEAGLACMWEENKKMDDPEVFVASLTEKALDGEDILKRTQDPEVKAKLIENTTAAVERGCFGIPTFYVGGEMFFGKDRLLDLEEEILAQA